MSAVRLRTKQQAVALLLAGFVVIGSGCGGETSAGDPAASRPPASRSPAAASTPSPSAPPASSTDLDSGPIGPGPAKTETRLRQLAATAATPIYYLGTAYHGWPLDDAIVFDANGTEIAEVNALSRGQTLTVGYGTYCSEGMCGWRVDVGAVAVDLANAVGCTREQPIRGVPTVSFAGDSVVLFTGDVALRVGTTPGDVKLATAAAKTVRRVGDPDTASPPLPPPPPSVIPSIDKACGARPGDHGPQLG